MLNSGIYLAGFVLALMFVYYMTRRMHRKEDDYAQYKEEEEKSSTEMHENTN